MSNKKNNNPLLILSYPLALLGVFCLVLMFSGYITVQVGSFLAESFKISELFGKGAKGGKVRAKIKIGKPDEKTTINL